MSNYRRGRAFEYSIIKKLEDLGYFCIRSAGSHTVVDIVALKPGKVLLVQCKKDGRISDKEREVLMELAGWSKVAIPVVASKVWLWTTPHNRQALD